MNIDRKEHFTFGPIKASEVLATAGNGAGLLYLLMDRGQFEAGDAVWMGRWRGDNVRIIGDYHPDNEFYNDTRNEWLLTVNNERHVVSAGGTGPINLETSDVVAGDEVGSWTNGTSSWKTNSFDSGNSTVIDIQDRDPEQGDHFLISGSKLDEDQYEHSDVVVEYVTTITSDWNEIGKPLKRELTALFSQSAVIEDLNELGRYDPDPSLLDTSESDNRADEDSNSRGQTTENASLSEFGSTDSETDTTQVAKPSTTESTVDNQTVQESERGNRNPLVIANASKQEYIELPSGDPAFALSDPTINAMVTYTLFDSVQDGTGFSGLHNVMDPTVHKAIQAKIQEEKQHEEETDSDRLSVYRTGEDDENWDKERLMIVAMASRHISDSFEFAGRWGGDDLSVTYPENLTGVESIVDNGEWNEISEGAREGTTEMLGEKWMNRYASPIMEELDAESLPSDAGLSNEI